MNIELVTFTHDELNKVCAFLSENYIEDNKFRYNYTIDFLKDYNINSGIIFNDEIVGFICGKIINLMLHNKEKLTAELNFLCVSKKYRNKQYCPLLINDIKNKFILLGVEDAIFSSEFTFPNSITHIDYYIHFLNVKKLIEIEYINTKASINQIEEHYKIPKLKPSKKELILVDNNNINKCFELYNTYFKQFDCYEKFTIDSFTKQFINDHIKTYILIENNIILDFISYYTIDALVLKQNIKTTDAYLYYYSNMSNNLYRMILMLIILCNSKNIDSFIALNIMDNNVFDDLKFIKKQTNFNYYLFINNIKIKNHKLAKILY